MSHVHYRIRHQTEYVYAYDVIHSHQLLHLRPRALDYQLCTEHSLRIEPQASMQLNAVDAFDNPVTRLEIDHPHQSLRVTTEMRISVSTRQLTLEQNSIAWETVRSRLMYSAQPPDADILDASRFRHESPYVRIKQVFDEYAADCFPANQSVLHCAELLMQKIFRDMTYSPGETQIATPLLDVLKHKRGVCQDYAHLMIACLRARGLAARYVSGYLRTTPKDGQPHLVGSDASHAWVAVYCPPLGWIEFDPTNNVRANRDHIVLAWGRDFGDVSPLRGVIVGGGQHEVKVNVDVAEIFS